MDSWLVLLLVHIGQGRYLNLSLRREYNDWVRLCLLADEVNQHGPLRGMADDDCTQYIREEQ